MAPEAIISKSVRIGEIELSYVDQEQGEAVVFVHGFPVSGRIWDEHREAIAPRVRVIAPTLRYFGSLPWIDDGHNFSTQTHADDLAAFIGTLELDPVAVMGWSYGGAVALTMAVQHPQLVKRLFLFEPSLVTIVADPADLERAVADRQDMIYAARTAVSTGDLDRAVQLFIDALNPEDGTFQRAPNRVQSLLREGARMLPLYFAPPPPPNVTSEDLSHLHMPVTIAVGSDSRVFFKVLAETASRCIPDAELITVPNARHMLPVQDPATFSRLVLEFIERN